MTIDSGRAMPPADDAALVPPESLTVRTARGAAWMASQTVVSRATSFAAQLILSYLLMPDDFGQISLVFTITTFATHLTNPGTDDVLLQKQKRMGRWLTPAFWLGLSCGFAGALAMAIAGVVVVSVAQMLGNEAYGNPKLAWMILILALGAPINAAALVPYVVLKSQLRFARVAAVNLFEVVAQQVLIVLLAWMGFGAFSFVIPMPLVALARTAILWGMAHPKVGAHLAMHRWPALTRDTGWVFGTRIVGTAVNQGDRILLGAIFASEALVGLYFFAFMLSVQIFRVLCDNSAAVLLPAFTQIHDDAKRLRDAVISACKSLTALVVPLATLQILLAGPVIRLLFAAKWEPAIPIVQYVSLGSLGLAPAWPIMAMMTARGEFRRAFFATLAYTLLFFAIVAPFTWFYSANGAAMGMSIWSWLTPMLLAVVAFRSADGAMIFFDCIRRPLAAAAVSAIVPALVIWRLPANAVADVIAVVVVTGVVLVTYAAVLRWLDPLAVGAIWRYFESFLRLLARLRRRAPAELGKSAAQE